MTRADRIPFLSVRNVWKHYPAQRGVWPWKKCLLPVLRDVSLTLEKGSTLGLLGESGSGKTTLSRLILGLEKPDAGSILLEGQPVREWRKRHRGKVSVVFQDYMTSVNPCLSVREIIAEGFHAASGGPAHDSDIHAMMARVELPSRLAACLPHQLSGGQVQRVCIARALASKPDLVVFDEAVSALDVSVQTEIVKLLRDIRENAAYLFITHDIQVAAMLCDNMALLHGGSIAEEFAVRNMASVASPYLRELLSSTVVFQSTMDDIAAAPCAVAKDA